MKIHGTDMGFLLVLAVMAIGLLNPEYITILIKSIGHVFMIAFNWFSNIIGLIEPPIPSNS